MNRLSGKIAVVTGGGGHIGSSVVRALAGEGALVAVVDLRREAAEKVASEIRVSGGAAEGIGLDISDYGAVEAAFDGVVSRHGGIDILINAAGGSARERMKLYHELPMEVLDQVIGMNLFGALYCVRGAVNHLIRRGGGRIVNIGSIVAQGGKACCVDYAAAKGGMIAATKSLAIELGRHGINVNCVSPGLVERNPDAIDQAAFAKRFSYLNRICTREDIAPLVLFLTLPESGYITGQNFVIDGGRSLGLKGDC